MPVNISADFGPLVEALDITEATTRVMETGRVQDISILAAMVASASAFNVHMDTIAEANPRNYHHVYEWGQVGEVAGRLWHLISVGSRNNRALNFKFIQSKSLVPAGEAETGIDGDTRKKVHIFRWKAYMMENGAEVTIYRKKSPKVLAFPAPGGGMMFRPGPWHVTLGGGTLGNFTSQWNEFFAVGALTVADQQVFQVVERKIQRVISNKLYPSVSKPVSTKKTNIKPKKKMKAKTKRVIEDEVLEVLASTKSKSKATGTVIL